MWTNTSVLTAQFSDNFRICWSDVWTFFSFHPTVPALDWPTHKDYLSGADADSSARITATPGAATAMQPQQTYDFSSDENSHKWRGLFVQALRKVTVWLVFLNSAPPQSPKHAPPRPLKTRYCDSCMWWLTLHVVPTNFCFIVATQHFSSQSYRVGNLPLIILAKQSVPPVTLNEWNITAHKTHARSTAMLKLPSSAN